MLRMTMVDDSPSCELTEIDGTTVYIAHPPIANRATLLLLDDLWGLNEQTRRLADQFATAAGYRVVAPSLMEDAGIDEERGDRLRQLSGDPDARRRMLGQHELGAARAAARAPHFRSRALRRLRAVVTHVARDEAGPLGVIGFGFGGTMAWRLAAADPRIGAIAPISAIGPSAEIARRITSPVLALLGARDSPVMQSLPDVVESMTHSRSTFEHVVYPGAGHAFADDGCPATYNDEAATDAWRRVLAFLQRELLTPPQSRHKTAVLSLAES